MIIYNGIACLRAPITNAHTYIQIPVDQFTVISRNEEEAAVEEKKNTTRDKHAYFIFTVTAI